MVTGFEEATAIYNDHATFSSCNTVAGPFAKWPVPLEGDDISDIIEQHRDGLMFSDQLPSFDPPRHTDHRGLLMRLITPKRLKENEEFMWRIADRQIDEFLPRGECEFVRDYANPFTLLVIADLLGVPEEDHEAFREELQGDERPTQQRGMAHKPLEFLYERFRVYIEDRRRDPRDDVMTQLATATFPDGTLPDVDDVMLIASNLFAAGGETTARLIATMLRFLGERPELQQQLREERDLIPAFIEETLRLETPLHAQFRLARVSTTIGGVDLPAGTTMMMLNGAANRDPRQFDDPERAPPRPGERPAPPRVRVRHPHVRGRAARAGRGPHQPRAHPRPHGRHHDLRGRARSGRRAPLRVLAHLPAARRRATPSRVHTPRTAVTAVVPGDARSSAARCRRTTSSSAPSSARG